uniref:Uncharacterized protein n=1 Tax=Tanacetum cinerariifolium TaxID=118510 RepID=A0A6L2KXA7_TANCI|nr:hypothetical protein [Tanacetum cinerariifolium]
MAALVILISSDPSKESVGSSISRLILFGTIPTDILATIPVIVPPVVHDDILAIPTETPIIPPVAPEAEAAIVASPAGVLELIVYSSTDSNQSKDISPQEHAPTLPDTSLFLCTDSSKTSSPSHDFSPVVVASLVPCRVVPAPPGVPRRPARLVFLGQEIPFGQPYCTHPNGVLSVDPTSTDLTP